MGAETENRGDSVGALAGIAVFDRNGDAVILDGCWSDQAAVLVFVRHFG